MAMTRKFVEVKSKYEHIQNWYEYNIFSIKCRQIYIFITFNSLILVLLFTKQFFTFHSKLNIVKCDKLILPTVDLNSQPPALAANVFLLDRKGLTVKNEQRRG